MQWTNLCKTYAETLRQLHELNPCPSRLPGVAGAAIGRTLPGIAISGFGSEEDLRDSERAGFAEHLTKPIDLNRLESAIRRVTSLAATRTGTGDSVSPATSTN